MFLQEREEAYQRELEIARVEKEKEIARLRAQQERAKDKQAEKVTGECLHPLSRFHSSFVFIFSAWEKLSGLLAFWGLGQWTWFQLNIMI